MWRAATDRIAPVAAMRRWAPFALAMLTIASSAPAQTPPVAPAATAPASAEIAIGDARQHRMTVPVTVNHAGPFPFVVDTGAERSVVSRELAQSLGLAAGGRARLFDFTGPSAVETVAVPSLSVGALDDMSLDSPALSAINLGAPGMLGIDALQGQRVVIDFNRQRMSLVPAKRHVSGEIMVHAEQRLGQLIVTDATFAGKPIAVIVDTGSGISVGNLAMLALAKRAPRPMGPISVTSVTGRSFDTMLVAIDDVTIGGARFDNFALAFADVAPFDRFGLRGRPALILGIGALKLFRRVEIDFANREIGFSLPRPPIDFDDACHNTASPCRTY